MKPTCLVVSLLALMPVPALAQDAPASEANVQISERLAAVLRTGRSVVSANQDLINDPEIGDKGLTPDVFLEQVNERFEKQTGEAILSDALSPLERELAEAQLAAMKQVITDNQSVINSPGVGFKGFIPAVFARLTNEHFAEAMGTTAKVKVTAPLDLVRNRKARPDAWEAQAIKDYLRQADWEKGKPFFEEIDENGTSVFRMLIPEYYSESCLSCHGSPEGEMDVTGFPKEGGEAGELAGAISVTLRR